VKKGYRLGLHVESGSKGGVCTGYVDDSDYPNFKMHDMPDDKIVSNGNIVQGVKSDNYRGKGRKYSFRALLFVDRGNTGKENCTTWPNKMSGHTTAGEMSKLTSFPNPISMDLARIF
jgi:hypothetical protein